MSRPLRAIAPITALLAAGLLCLAPQASNAESHDDDAFLSFRARELITGWEEDWEGFSPAGGLYYNRVDGLLLYAGVAYRSYAHLHPRLRIVAARPTARDASFYQFDVEQPIHSQDSFSFGLSFYDRTDWSREDGENLSDTENTLLAFFMRQELRDYFARDGVTIFVQQIVNPDLTFRLEYRNDGYRSLTTRQHVWSAFRQKQDWRENPPLSFFVDDVDLGEFEGRLKGYFGSFVYETHDDPAERLCARGFFEFYGTGTGSDHGLRKYVFDVRKYIRLSETMRLRLRGAWGIASGDVPSHKVFYLGGIGTLRGYDYKAFSGKNLFLASADYVVDVNPEVRLIFFADTGQTWWGTSGFDSDEMKSDIGMGVELPDVDLRIDVARPATMEESDIRVTLRLGHVF